MNENSLEQTPDAIRNASFISDAQSNRRHQPITVPSSMNNPAHKQRKWTQVELAKSRYECVHLVEVQKQGSDASADQCMNQIAQLTNSLSNRKFFVK